VKPPYTFSPDAFPTNHQHKVVFEARLHNNKPRPNGKPGWISTKALSKTDKSRGSRIDSRPRLSSCNASWTGGAPDSDQTSAPAQHTRALTRVSWSCTCCSTPNTLLRGRRASLRRRCMTRRIVPGAGHTKQSNSGMGVGRGEMPPWIRKLTFSY